MATKPTSATFTHATDAKYSTGPAAPTGDTKIAFPSAAEGCIPGQPVDAENLNFNFNICGQWSVWLDAGSSDPTDATAHLVETNGSGTAGVPKLQAGHPAWADSAIVATNDDAAAVTISAQNASGVAAEFTSLADSAVQAYTNSSTATDAAFNAIVTGSGAAGFYSAINTANSTGVRVDVTSTNASAIVVDVDPAATGSVGVNASCGTLGSAIRGLTTGGGFGVEGRSDGSGIAVSANATTTGIGLSANAAFAIPFLCGANSQSGALRIDALGGNPAAPTDGTLAYVSAAASNHSLRAYFDFGSGVADYLIHKTRFGNFGDSDGTLGVAATGVGNPTPLTVCTINAGADEMPQKASAPAVIEFSCDVYTASTISGTPPSIDVAIEDTTAGTVIGGTITDCIRLDVINRVYQVNVRLPYTIPAIGARSFTAKVSNGNGGGESLAVRNPMLTVRPARS